MSTEPSHSRHEASRPRGPDFLGIGAPRCGTSWLYRIFYRHPDLWVPPIKELHYFDSIDPQLDEGFRADQRSYRLRNHVKGRLEHYLARTLVPLRPSLRDRVNTNLQWDLRYFLGDGSLSWYCSLFDQAREKNKRVGEITPAYSMLSDGTIRTIHTLNPAMKIILLLRDPIERAWSGATMRLRTTDPGALDEAHLLRRLTSEGNRRRTSYLDNLERWERIFDTDNIFVGFYEDVRDRPKELIGQVCEFLNVADISDSLPEQSYRRVNVSHYGSRDMPDGLALELARLYEPQLRRLKDRVPGPPTLWHNRAGEILSRHMRKL